MKTLSQRLQHPPALFQLQLDVGDGWFSETRFSFRRRLGAADMELLSEDSTRDESWRSRCRHHHSHSHGSWSWSSRCQTLCATEQTTMQPRRELSGRSGLSVDVNTQASSGIQDVLFLHVFVITFSPDRYYGVVTHQQGLNFWLVTEFVTGHCLAKLLQQPDLKSLYKIRRKERLRMSACLASAMDYLHNRFHRILWQLLFHCPLYLHHPHTPKTFYARNNIYILYSVATHRKLVHGDLTPSNVMVCQHGDSKQVKITDFGLLEVDFLW